MSDAADIAAGVAIAWLRSTAVAVLAVVAGERLAAAFRRLPSGAVRSLAIVLCALPFVVPALVQGYAWSQLSLSLVRWPALLELWYAALLCVRLVPVATLVLCLAPPPPLSPSAAFCRALLPASAPLRQASLGQRLQMALLGPWRNRLLAGIAVFLIAFPEFEVASLSGANSWTVTLFKAHAGGLEWSASLALATPPALVQFAALGVGWLAFRSWRPVTTRGVVARTPAPAGASFWLYLTCAAMLGAIVPAVLLAAEGGSARELPWAQLAAEIGWSLWFAVPAAACSWWCAGLVVRRPARWWLSCLPGLCGALVLGLALLGLFQLPVAVRLYDTPVPLLIALTCLLLPTAGLLRSTLERRTTPAVHLAALLDSGEGSQRRAASRLRWQLRGRPLALLWSVLLFGALFEVVAASLLHPVTMTPAAVRLYNLMHYGHGAVLSGMVLALVCTGLGTMALVTWLPGVVWGFAAARKGERRG